jgi:SAM-dependent methyltransferase
MEECLLAAGGDAMSYCCPSCKGALNGTPVKFRCESCRCDYPVVNGIPDFYVEDPKHDFGSDANVIWLEPDIVEARDMYYELSIRELKGMDFCMRELGRITDDCSTVLEVGMGTGHFSRWLSEACSSGTEIFSYDFSWPIIEYAVAKTMGLKNVNLFRANTRSVLPFPHEFFDVVFCRLAPLGPSGVPNVQYGFSLLKPGGWYIEAGWNTESFETPPTAWAYENGYDYAENHEWIYTREISREEADAMQTEHKRMSQIRKHGRPGWPITEVEAASDGNPQGEKKYLKTTEENLLMARKPCGVP